MTENEEDLMMMKVFWNAPDEAFFGQEYIAVVTCKAIRTLEMERCRGISIPFRKVGGRVLYRKVDVVKFLESHELITCSNDKEGEELE